MTAGDSRSGAGEPADRPGPMPPRIEPTWVMHAAPAASGPPAPAATGNAPAVSGPAAVSPAPPPYGQPMYAATPSPYRASAGYPVPYAAPSGPTPAGPGVDHGAFPSGLAPAAAGRRRLAWPGILALVLVLALAGVVVFQARQIDRMNAEMDRADNRLSQEQAADDGRLDGLENRAEALEKAAGQVFNPEAIASAVLPSVFRVEAGNFTGTAFAVGKPAASGGTNLFTNFHVVESVWDGGGREVQIERRGESYPARIVKVDEANDVAQLTTTSKFDGLVTASAGVKSGQQIVVVGAPLGLEDTVTTGVVSAFRKREDGSGSVIQFSAPINPGNSGGPVINGEKHVVGIATAKAADAEGIGLAVPIKTACDEFKIC
jgi:S1-C subfamily serine protease